jgi:hypothetical protein
MRYETSYKEAFFAKLIGTYDITRMVSAASHLDALLFINYLICAFSLMVFSSPE